MFSVRVPPASQLARANPHLVKRRDAGGWVP